MTINTAPAESTQRENPFIYNAPVRGYDFCNREDIIEKLLNETVNKRSQGNVWITGERQIGKTSLMRYFQVKYERDSKRIKLYGTDDIFSVAFIYLNVQDTNTREDFFRNLRQGLKNYFDFKIDICEDAYVGFVDYLSALYREKYYVVFLLDEFDAFIEQIADQDPINATSFLAELNKLIQGVSEIKDDPKIFGCIFVANHTIEELLNEKNISRRGSGLIVEHIEMEWFSEEQVKELVQRYLKDNPISFSQEEIDLCFKMTQGYPYFVQKFLSIMYEHKASQPITQYNLAEIKKEYALAFKETVNGWGQVNMPVRTRDKLKSLIKKIPRSVGDHSVSMVFKIIEEGLINWVTPK